VRGPQAGTVVGANRPDLDFGAIRQKIFVHISNVYTNLCSYCGSDHT
jgi:hypothetical protein